MSTETAVIKMEQVTEIMTGTGAILTHNKGLTQKAIDKAQSILDTIEAQGMSEELDAECNKWQVNAKKALQIINEKRSPITQIMTQLAKQFTELEANFDPKKPESFYGRIQNHRNNYAKSVALAEQKKQEEIMAKQRRDKELVDLKSEVELQLRDKYNSILAKFKKYAVDTLNGMTLDNLEETRIKLTKLAVTYPKADFDKIDIVIRAQYVAKEDVDVLIKGTKEVLYDELSANFRENMEAVKEEQVSLIPSKKRELEEMARAGEEKRKQLEAEAAERQRQQEEQMKAEAEKQKQEAADKVKLQKEMEQAQIQFDAAAQLSEAKSDTAAKVREGYKINIKHVDGWGAIFLFYYDKEGKNLTVDEMGKKTMAQMKTFCENHAKKTDEKIASIHLEYEEVYKAVATKS